MMPRPSKEHAIQRLQKMLNRIPEILQERGLAQFTKWQRDTRIAIEYTFGEGSSHAKEFIAIEYTNFYAEEGSLPSLQTYADGLTTATALLQSMITEIEEYWTDEGQQTASHDGQELPSPATLINTTSRVFLIHGRDQGTRDTVTRFLEGLGLEPIVLAEQPDEGRTIIEKFEQCTQGDFALALFTPDDVGGLGESSLQYRARQNVIFEFGYCIGKFGRDRVRVLVKGDVEIPSDYSGVLYISMDGSDGWKMNLIRELKSAGFNIDANRAFSGGH